MSCSCSHLTGDLVTGTSTKYAPAQYYTTKNRRQTRRSSTTTLFLLPHGVSAHPRGQQPSTPAYKVILADMNIKRASGRHVGGRQGRHRPLRLSVPGLSHSTFVILPCLRKLVKTTPSNWKMSLATSSSHIPVSTMSWYDVSCETLTIQCSQLSSRSPLP